MIVTVLLLSLLLLLLLLLSSLLLLLLLLLLICFCLLCCYLVNFSNGDVNKNCDEKLSFTLYKSVSSADNRKKLRRTLVGH